MREHQLFDHLSQVTLKTQCKGCYACCVDLVVEIEEEDELLWEEMGIYREIIKQTELEAFFPTPSSRILKQRDDGTCVFLINGLCSIQDFKPKVCRDFEYLGKNCKLLRERFGFEPDSLEFL